ncbi:LysR family transcriptional regulator [Tabrizicola sp.]|uniref:LysR family transcriptional regulator n=1 Tax=Tabrizicola sp. TaxID=2005166 RepID=UPI00286B2AA1|nr:LysR family transcriptional regulator [Tabrizicola sp.]
MPRNLDVTALRSFIAVADAGGVTRASGFLNLTQSAVSMQIKRLEESLDVVLLDRTARKVALTPTGELLLGYARRILALNDEAFQRLTTDVHEGEIVLGVPHDIVYPAIPLVLQRFAREYPKMKVTLLSSYTTALRDKFDRGECDVILTTEPNSETGSETLAELPLVWFGATDGVAWKSRPLKLAFEPVCGFRKMALTALDAAGIPWVMAVESDSTRTIEATVSADLAVNAILAGSEPPNVEPVQHGGTLPDLGWMKVNLYVGRTSSSPTVDALAELIRRVYAGGRFRSAATALLDAAE